MRRQGAGVLLSPVYCVLLPSGYNASRMLDNEFEGRVAIVTGASSGIGRAAAEMFAERGARVAAFARSEAPLREMESHFEGGLIAVPGDLTEEADLARLFAETESKLGPCDILVNNAGAIVPTPLPEMTAELWDLHFAVNVRAAFQLSRLVAPGMTARGRGAIVNVASISGVLGPQKFPGFTAYAASKAALISFTEAFAVEAKESGIRVNCISPGSVDTPMLRQANPALVPDMTSREVAEVILFLASERSRPINGQNIHVYSS